MRTDGLAWMLNPAMGLLRHVTATLEADLHTEGSIHGSLLDEDGEPIPFSGWLDLAGAITTLADRTSREDAPAEGEAAARESHKASDV